MERASPGRKPGLYAVRGGLAMPCGAIRRRAAAPLRRPARPGRRVRTASGCGGAPAPSRPQCTRPPRGRPRA
ncbi:hypothetical protein G6F32_017005 [Rhizopus arrhizus]|nr:hypothetical protein G6F32_017005 [Rhizopus arrhizus]